MKKILTYTLSFIIILGSVIPSFSYAQTTRTGDCTITSQNTAGVLSTNTISDFREASCVPTNSSLVRGTDKLISVTFKATKTETTDVTIDGTNGIEAAASAVVTAWDWLNPFWWIPKILSMIVYLIMKILSLFLSLAGLLLNLTIQVTIMQMADRVNAMTGINVAWKVLRDLMNIGFIFMLLYQGIKLIISQDSIDSIRQFIIGIVLASLFINFSLFFTKVLIDTSNIATVGIYNTIIGDTESASAGLDRGLSNALMTTLGIQSFFSTDTILSGDVQDDYSQLTSNVMACILIIVATIVFFAISAMFITRYLVLILLLALSPIAYMGMAFKGLQGYSKKWWDTLWGQLIFAPLYMLMTWVTLTLIAGNFGSKVDPIQLGSWTMVATTNIFFNYALIIGLTVASLFIAKEYSTKGAAEVGKLSSAITSFAGGAVMGGGAWASRRTIGNFALGDSSVEELQQRVAQGGAQGLRAQARLALATTSFDARRSPIAEQLAKTTGVNLGSGLPFKPKAGEGGRAATVADKKKEFEANADAIVKRYTEKGDWAGLATYMKTGKTKWSDLDLRTKMSQKEWESTQKYIYNKKLDARGRTAIDSAIADPAFTKTLQDKLPTDDQVKRFTETKDWAGLARFMETKPDGTPRSVQDRDDIYRKLSDRDRVGVEQSRIISVPDIEAMRNSLSLDEQINVYRSRKNWVDMATFLQTIPITGGRRSDQEQAYIYEKLSTRDRVSVEEHLAQPDIDRLRSTLSSEDEENVKKETRKVRAAEVQDHLVDNIEDLVAGRAIRHPAPAPAGGGPAPATTFDTEMIRLSPKEAHSLSNDALKNPSVIQKLTPQHLADILANKDDLAPDTKDQIRDEIYTGAPALWPLQSAQLRYLNSNDLTKANWGMP